MVVIRKGALVIHLEAGESAIGVEICAVALGQVFDLLDGASGVDTPGEKSSKRRGSALVFALRASRCVSLLTLVVIDGI